MDEVVNDDELLEDVNPIPLKERPEEDVEGDESTTNSYSEQEFAPTTRWTKRKAPKTM
jgi:hypothetical protein